jgi:hypothetical protein
MRRIEALCEQQGNKKKVQRSTNRFVDPTERPKIGTSAVVDDNWQPTENAAPAADNPGAQNQDMAGNVGVLSREEEDEYTIGESLRQVGEGAGDFMCRVFGGIVMDDDEANNGGVSASANNDLTVGETDAYADEDPFESSNEDLLDDLPTENDPNFPQEDANYFRRKNYVRKDKYDLAWFFLLKGVKIPQLEDLFDSKSKT